MARFDVEVADYAAQAADLHAVRDAVFVHEQRVPATLERDAADPRCLHVLAREVGGRPVGTARLVPPFVAVNAHAATDSHASGDPLPRIGRMAVLPDWRGQGVGAALLAALEDQARARGWPVQALHAQAPAVRFYARLGYVPAGPRFMEAGIEHQAMSRQLDGAVDIESREAAAATVVALAHATRRCLRIYSRALDPGVLDAPDALDALRRLSVRGGGIEIRVLLHDAATPQREQAPLLSLAQRLPSVFALREVDDPVDRADASAFIANDAGGSYFRTLGHRFEGEVQHHARGRSRQLVEAFDRIWERARPCSELRALGL